MLAATGRPAHRFVSVRAHGSVRTLVVLGPQDRLTYARLGASVAPAVESALSDRVVANRVAACSQDPPRLELRPWRVERRAFASALRELARGHRTLAFADVAGCYPSIGPRRVRETLEALGCDLAPRVERFLRRLGDEGIRGLPIGPEPSAVLANAVLAGVDRALEARGLVHLRWVDDVVIGVADPAQAERALATVRRTLRGLGLRANERKTRIVVDPSTLVAEPSAHRGRPTRVG